MSASMRKDITRKEETWNRSRNTVSTASKRRKKQRLIAPLIYTIKISQGDNERKRKPLPDMSASMRKVITRKDETWNRSRA
ncbi:hypothetical protein CEXT_342311 [Caerostris extrusa]|uniref:Uncharacterized protein n=1 Tax=Caerostris extrusa TaxID=172846 RepID=A0AAV4RYD2_CAEEX|nr:hypothetical protein CEXT_342311 [Caerostris extrusa]